MQLIELPPGPEPPRLTAHHSSHNLREHLAAFMCANNKRGFVPDLPPEDSPFMAMLLEWHERPGATVEQFKRQAHRLKDTTGKGAKRTVQLGHCFEVLAAAFGYKTYTAARHFRTSQDWIRNRT